MDFYKIVTGRINKNLAIYPEFVVSPSKDLMIRGGNYYAIWNVEKNCWDQDPLSVARIIDREMLEYKKANSIEAEVMLMSLYNSRMWTRFKEYVTDLPDNYHDLDDKVTFLNTPTTREDYRSKRLPYALEEGDYSAYEEIISTLYDSEERMKLEWAIGSIVSGESSNIQKFVVLYGDAGAGKSTILHIIEWLFEGYFVSFDAKSMASSNNSFSTEVFRTNPLVAIQHDGDLSRIEDNTKLNSIVSHELMSMNEKFKSTYTSKSNAFLFMATNKPVKITDAKSGVIRRLIDVKPSGRLLERERYDQLYEQCKFELGAIAYHCLEVYKNLGKSYYDKYTPFDMMMQTDVFFNFIEENYLVFSNMDGVTLKQAYEMYKAYCNDAKVSYQLPMYMFREELKNYFSDYKPFARITEGNESKQVRKYYSGFIKSRFVDEYAAEVEETNAEKEKSTDETIAVNKVETIEEKSEPENKSWIVLKKQLSLLDEVLSDCPAQYATKDETPQKAWDNVSTKVIDLNTRRTHYILVPESHIVIDFDLTDENGEKSLERNIEAASKWKPTYAETSKSGKGLHLHYVYTGNPRQLSAIYEPGIEIKVYTGKSALRRKLTICNDIPVATINSGLPLKAIEENKPTVIDYTAVSGEKALRTIVMRNLRKEYHNSTKSSVDFIYKVLEDAYHSGARYDLTDLRPSIMSFAMNSTHQADLCLKMVNKMHFKSNNVEEYDNKPDEIREEVEKAEYGETKEENSSEAPIVFYDVEVFKNLFVVVWKVYGEKRRCVEMINPSPSDMEKLFKFRLIGFNNKDYDNHMLYGRYIGYSNEQLYELSQRIISGSPNAKFREAYNLSYTDIYDFSSKKQSLKKWEIELGITHMEWQHPWDEPVAEEDFQKVAEYCCNDVISTEKLFDHLKEDWLARQILADLADGTVNMSTNALTARIIFGKEKKPLLVYTDLATGQQSEGR